MTDTAALIQRLASERILILDGAMGTAIQGYQLTEADFRGRRFERHGKELKGIDLIRFDEDGKIVDFEVMVRPMSGLQALGDLVAVARVEREERLAKRREARQ